VVWRIFQVNKADVATSHWPNGQDIMPKKLSYDVWKWSLKVLQNKRTQEKVKEDLSLVSIPKLKKIKNEMDLLLGDKVPSQCHAWSSTIFILREGITWYGFVDTRILIMAF
jgi:hypothetical protein